MPGQGSGKNVLDVIASGIIPGLGQFQQGRKLMAFIQFVLAVVLWFYYMGWIIHLWSIIDAERFDPKKVETERKLLKTIWNIFIFIVFTGGLGIWGYIEMYPTMIIEPQELHFDKRKRKQLIKFKSSSRIPLILNKVEIDTATYIVIWEDDGSGRPEETRTLNFNDNSLETDILLRARKITNRGKTLPFRGYSFELIAPIEYVKRSKLITTVEYDIPWIGLSRKKTERFYAEKSDDYSIRWYNY